MTVPDALIDRLARDVNYRQVAAYMAQQKGHTMRNRTLVRWRLAGASFKHPEPFTRWHIDDANDHDDTGRTACGREYPKRGPRSKQRQDSRAVFATVVCKQCQQAAPDTEFDTILR